MTHLLTPWIRSVSLLCTLSILACQTAPPKTESPRPAPIREVRGYTTSDIPDENQILSNSKIPSSQIGYILYDPETKKTLKSLNHDRAFIPSSSIKILPALAALTLLKPDFRFKTTLSYNGSIDHHTLKGNLYLKGTGDPLLTASDLMGLVSALKRKGIYKLEGSFFFDESFFIAQERIDESNDPFEGYNSGISALSCEFNQLNVRWKVSQKECIAEAFSTPDLPLFELGLIESSNDGNLPVLSYRSGQSTEQWLLSPSAPREGKRRVPIKRPGFFTALLFNKFAAMNGIILSDPIKGTTPKKSTLLTTHESLPLVELVQKLLEYSNNLMTELIQIAAAQQVAGKTLQLTEASHVIEKWIKKQIPNTNWKHFNLDTGSGLGSTNRVTPNQMSAMLEYADQNLEGERPFFSLLPISGWKGSLAERLNPPPLAFRVWAKTGTQSFSGGLVGYLFTQSGKKLIFAILATDFTKRAKVDQFPETLPSALSSQASSWQAKIRDLQDQMIAKWIQEN